MVLTPYLKWKLDAWVARQAGAHGPEPWLALGQRLHDPQCVVRRVVADCHLVPARAIRLPRQGQLAWDWTLLPPRRSEDATALVCTRAVVFVPRVSVSIIV